MVGTRNKRADDNRIIALNSLGLSLSKIGEYVGIHYTTVTYRLKTLGIEPADTRRSFMDDIYESLSPTQRDWLLDQLGPDYPIKSYIRSLIIKEFLADRTKSKLN